MKIRIKAFRSSLTIGHIVVNIPYDEMCPAIPLSEEHTPIHESRKLAPVQRRRSLPIPQKHLS
jgi:hypothetical protein